MIIFKSKIQIGRELYFINYLVYLSKIKCKLTIENMIKYLTYMFLSLGPAIFFYKYLMQNFQQDFGNKYELKSYQQDEKLWM